MSYINVLVPFGFNQVMNPLGEHISPDCPPQIGTVNANNIVWEKVCRAINQPEILLAEAHNWVDELHANPKSVEVEEERIQRKLDSLTPERQSVITQARIGGIRERDVDYQLSALALQGLSLKRDLATVEQEVSIQLLNDWNEQIQEYLADLQIGIASLNHDPQSPEDGQEILE